MGECLVVAGVALSVLPGGDGLANRGATDTTGEETGSVLQATTATVAKNNTEYCLLFIGDSGTVWSREV